MTALKTHNRRPAAGDPLDDLLDDTTMKRSGARARPRVTYPPSGSGRNVWWFAVAASVIWIAAVLAFAWGRFALPGDPGSVIDAAQSRLGFADWLMVGAAIVGPILLIWVIAWLVRRSMELRDESRRLAKAAILLADAAETAEKRAERLLPSPDDPAGEIITQGPGHLHREIERASNAMHALQTQMAMMETALARQAAAFDEAAEKTAERTKLLGPEDAPRLVNTGSAVSSGAADFLTDIEDKPADAVDFAIGPETEADRLRRELRAAGQDAGWTKLVEEKVAKTPAKSSAPASVLDDLREDVAAIQAKSTPAPGTTIDPFDDLGPSAPKAAMGAAVGAAGVAMGFGATRDDDAADGPKLGAPETDEPGPIPVPPPPATEVMPKAEDFEFMARALDWQKFVRAANFPENENDNETLDALYEVLTDPQAAALLQSSEDTLATLADLDLYMEDFVPEMSPIMAWREHLDDRFGLVNGIDAPIEKSRINAKLSSDDSFRKLIDRFVERYRVVLKRLFDEGADDRLALELADSRTGRAYLLVAEAVERL